MIAATHPFLASLTPEELRKIGLAQTSFDDESPLFLQGQALDIIYLIVAGQVAQIARDKTLGVRAVFDYLGPGEAVGAILDPEGCVSRYDYVARGKVDALALPADDFLRLRRSSLKFSDTLLDYVAAKARLFEDRAVTQGRTDITRVIFDETLLNRLTAQYILSKRVLPVALQGSVLTVATAWTDSAAVEADMRRLFNVSKVVIFRIAAKDFERAYRESVQSKLDVSPGADHTWFRAVKNRDYAVSFNAATDQPSLDATRKESEIEGANIIQLTNKLIGEALDLGASDIHFEPYPNGMDVRYRIDGELLMRPERVQAGYLQAVLSRIKVVAGLDIAEKRKPQDGRITATCAGKTVDVRVSTVPTRFGEKIVLRILDPSSMLLELDSLIESHEVYKAVNWMVKQPYGMILIAGPTGAGKTTTVYSMLLEKRSLPVNIMTIEDPIEYSLKGITQVQRNLHVNLDFPNAIRSFLRQDPDVIIVGETRDAETARAALEAGLTGHLVISTVHANNVFATIYRLKEMGMEPFVIANSVIGVLSQRLVRRICPRCSQTHQYHKNLIEPLHLHNLGEPHGDYYHFRKGTGCLHCNSKGYKGRAAAFESLVVREELKGLIAANVPYQEVAREALALGAYVPMHRYASVLLSAGITTPEEVARILFTESNSDGAGEPGPDGRNVE
jgi:type II secretory ATPase GspE/PulE/Tfp pilus assembly ATPase PilB-like protein